MSKNVFTKEQLEALKNNPNVESVTEKRISYTEEFKKRFIEEYRIGKKPSRIFSEAGFDVNALGNKRIERASDRWRTEYNEGRLGKTSGFIEVHRDKKRGYISLKDQLAEREKLIMQLRRENNQLKDQLTRRSTDSQAEM